MSFVWLRKGKGTHVFLLLLFFFRGAFSALVSGCFDGKNTDLLNWLLFGGSSVWMPRPLPLPLPRYLERGTRPNTQWSMATGKRWQGNLLRKRCGAGICSPEIFSVEKNLVGKMASATCLILILMVTVFLVILFRDISREVTRYNKKAGCKNTSYWPICRRTLGTFQVEDISFRGQTGHLQKSKYTGFPKT